MSKIYGMKVDEDEAEELAADAVFPSCSGLRVAHLKGATQAEPAAAWQDSGKCTGEQQHLQEAGSRSSPLHRHRHPRSETTGQGSNLQETKVNDFLPFKQQMKVYFWLFFYFLLSQRNILTAEASKHHQ